MHTQDHVVFADYSWWPPVTDKRMRHNYLWDFCCHLDVVAKSGGGGSCECCCSCDCDCYGGSDVANLLLPSSRAYGGHGGQDHAGVRHGCLQCGLHGFLHSWNSRRFLSGRVSRGKSGACTKILRGRSKVQNVLWIPHKENRFERMNWEFMFCGKTDFAKDGWKLFSSIPSKKIHWFCIKKNFFLWR